MVVYYIAYGHTGFMTNEHKPINKAFYLSISFPLVTVEILRHSKTLFLGYTQEEDVLHVIDKTFNSISLHWKTRTKSVVQIDARPGFSILSASFHVADSP